MGEGLDDRGDQSELMRAGVRDRVARLAQAAGSGTRRWAPPVLLAALSAGAFTPLLVSVIGGGPVAAAVVGAAAVNAATAVGGNVLTDVIKAGVGRIRGKEVTGQEFQESLERWIQQALEESGPQARKLRAELAGILARVDAVGAGIVEVVRTGNRELQIALTSGLAELAVEFSEFEFVLAEMEAQLLSIRESVDRASGLLLRNTADLQVAVGLQYRQAIDTRLLLNQVSMIERRTRGVPHPAAEDATGPSRRSPGECPYRGLQVFDATDGDLFFGRESATAELMAVVAQHLAGPGLVIVTGASGVGKSSLLRAGLLPALMRGEVSEQAGDWPWHLLGHPAHSPLTQLATLLAGLAALEAPAVLETLTARPDQAHLLVRQAAQADARRRGLPEAVVDRSRLVLVVDQFEEVFTPHDADAGEEREAFITALSAIATLPCGPQQTPAGLVVAAVRGNHIDRCAGYPALAAALTRPFVLGPMTESELRRAITLPAAVAGIGLEPGLADTILAELRSRQGGYDPGALPLLSQAMVTTWEHREGDRLTAHGYGRTGGVNRAVATSAEAAYTGLDAAGQELARAVFQRLTATSTEGEPTRRAAGHGRLCADLPGADRVLEAFARRRLLVIDEKWVQIAHDALLASWPRLRDWLKPDLATYAQYIQLVQDAAAWDESGRRPGYLYRGERLAGLLHVLPGWRADPERRPVLTPVEEQFVAEAVRVSARGRLLRRAAAGTLVVLTIAAVGAAVVARGESDTRRTQQGIAVSRQLAAQSMAVGDGDPVISRLLAVTAWRIAPTDEARYSMLTALTRPGVALIRGQPPIAVSPDGTMIASREGQGIRLWDPDTGRALGGPYPGLPDDFLHSMAFSPDGRTLAIGGPDLRLWDVPSHRFPPGSTIRFNEFIYSVAYSPDGRILAAAGAGDVILLEASTHRVIDRWTIGAPSSVAFNRDGTRLAIGNSGGRVQVWDVARGKPVGPAFRGYTGQVHSVAFSPDGRTVASGTLGRMNTFETGAALWVWQPGRDRRTARKLVSQEDAVEAVAYSPDGSVLASVGDDRTVRLWDARTARPLGRTLGPHTGPITDIAFLPDGRLLAAASDDGTIRVWNLRADRQLSAPIEDVEGMAMLPAAGAFAAWSGQRLRLWDPGTGHPTGPALRWDGAVFGALGADDTGTVVAGDSDGDLWTWEVNAPSPAPHRLGTQPAAVASLVVSPDGRTFVTTDPDGVTRIWDRAGPTASTLSGRPDGLAFSPDGRSLAAGGPDGDVLIWALGSKPAAGEVRARLAVPITGVAFSPDGTTLAVGASDGQIRLLDPATGRARGRPLLGHTAAVRGLAFSPDGGVLASVGEDATARLWDVRTAGAIGEPVKGPAGVSLQVGFAEGGRVLVVRWYKTIHRYDVAYLADPATFICAKVQRSLTPSEWTQLVRDPQIPYRTACRG